MEISLAPGGVYVQLLRGRNTPIVESCGEVRDLMLVDVEHQPPGGWEGLVADQLRYIDETVVEGLRYLLIRPPYGEGVSRAQTLIVESIHQRTQHPPAIALLDFKVGMAGPGLQPITGEVSRRVTPGLLARARSLEIAALLERGRAHWRPAGFHFALPSGEHRDDFIRVGDGFRHPRDAEALATWLYPVISDGLAVVADSSTLVPLLQAVRSAAHREGIDLGATAIRDDYPDSLLTDESMIQLTTGASGVLALLSVSSTGRTAESFAIALDSRVPDWQLEVLVTRQAAHSTLQNTASQGPSLDGQGRPWLHVPDTNRHWPAGVQCDLCENSDQSPVVRIDPRSFSNTALPGPAVVVMPDPPHRDRELDLLLEMYERTDGIGIDCDAAVRTRLRRERGAVGLRFYPQRLVRDDAFVRALGHQLRSPTESWRDGRSDLPCLEDFDSIVYLKSDVAAAGDAPFRRALDLVCDLFAKPGKNVIEVALGDEPDEDLSRAAEALKDSRHVLVFALGLVTGGTLQEMLIKVGSARSRGAGLKYDVSALVLHARPRSFGDWQAIRSSFYRRLVAAWITYMPKDHPFEVEKSLLGGTLDTRTLSAEAVQYVQSRRRWVVNSVQSDWSTRLATWSEDGVAHNPRAVLLCANPTAQAAVLPRLLPGSRFGHRMSMVGTLAGVGATMHRARLEQQLAGGPPGLQFDLTRIPVVYFEAPIISAILRWIRPSETHWEYSGRTAEDVIREAWHRARHEPHGNQVLLLAELLLAGAADRLPRHTKSLLTDLAAELKDRVDSAAFAPVEVAASLVAAAWAEADAAVEERAEQGVLK